MKRKIIRFAAVTLFSCAFLLLLGSMPAEKKAAQNNECCDLKIIKKSLNSAVNSDISAIQQKNPLILLELSVE